MYTARGILLDFFEKTLYPVINYAFTEFILLLYNLRIINKNRKKV